VPLRWAVTGYRLGVFLALASQATATAAQTRPVVLAIEHVTVLPMTQDTALVDHTVLVRDDRIVSVGRSTDVRIPPGARTVNGRGRFLIPGLADMHVHLRSPQHLSQFVAAGVTTVRNMHGGPEHVAWRERVTAGTLAGPTIFTSGPPLGQYRVNPDPRFVGLRTTADADKVVREQAEAGYDMIKVIQRISAPVYEHLVKVARAARMPVVGHVIPGIGLQRSLAVGQVSVEHLDGLRNRSRVASLFGANEKGFDDDARAIARYGAWVGTIASSRTGHCEPPTDIVRRSIASLRRAEVKMLAGSDAGIGPVRPGSALHCELATLVSAGMTPYEALATATVNAGEFARTQLKRAQIPFGTVTPGARADLVMLAADPRADIRVLAQPIGVVVRGVWLPRR
jgi:imidazolonepropionase-like amidohydrolase